MCIIFVPCIDAGQFDVCAMYAGQLDVESMGSTHVETQGSEAVVFSLYSDATKAPRVSKLRRSRWMRYQTNLEYSHGNYASTSVRTSY